MPKNRRRVVWAPKSKRDLRDVWRDISNDELDKCAKDQNVEIRRGDFVIIRTGQMERCLKEKQWGGYAGGDAPGVKFENCYWCQAKQIAAICTDTGGVEVRPNETTQAHQPWHW